MPGLDEDRLQQFKQGQSFRAYEYMGCHPHRQGEVSGWLFSVWAPNARGVSLVGDFNGWTTRRHPMRCRGETGVWELFLPFAGRDDLYKFAVHGKDGTWRMKADPFAFDGEVRPKSASRVHGLPDRDWSDEPWMEERFLQAPLDQPLAAYEVHLPSWRTDPDGNPLPYDRLAEELIEHLDRTNFTHVELMPVLEHPLDESWGYQVTGYFRPFRRMGSPEGFAGFVDRLHRAGYGVLLDWVPAHFPKDEHGLYEFDGTHLFEHADPRLGHHPDWGTAIFNYERNEVRSFLISSALFWLDRYHLDGLRMDAVASMLYRDYSREEDWVPNRYGGRENLGAIDFLRRCNEAIRLAHPGALSIAEESTAWGGVSRPSYDRGGLGFHLKWNMGWMHDTLSYFKRDPVHRTHHHDELRFALWYAFEENFQLVLSHDEVVHGKRSLLSKMPGDDWQKFANLRLLYGFQYTHPGKKLLFMGGEFGQRQEWRDEQSLDWHLLEESSHGALLGYVARLNELYTSRPELWKGDHDSRGFEWIVSDDADQSVFAYLRRPDRDSPGILVVLNATPVPRENYRLGTPWPGEYSVVLNSDRERFGGSGTRVGKDLRTSGRTAHGRDRSLELTLPALSTLLLAPDTVP